MSSLANQARPLLFLTFRSLFNGIKRAITSPRRLIGLILFFGYYFMIFIRPAMGTSGTPGLPSNMVGQVPFPPAAIIDAVAWGILSVLSLFMLMGIQSANTGYKSADVDVLFSTPISPKVLLVFRIARDYLITLLVPLFIAILGLRPARMGWESIFKDMPNPEYASMTLRLLTVAWILMALAWVMMSYAVSLWVNRSDPRSDLRRRLVGWGVAVAITAVIAYVFLRLRGAEDVMAAYIAVSQTPWLRGVFFVPSLATELVTAPVLGRGVGPALGGAAGLLALIAGGFYLAIRQSAWMYDQAAIKAYSKSNFQELQKSGDVMGAVAERIRTSGKRTSRKQNFLNRLVMRGPWAIVWKELILQTRALIGMVLMLSLMGVALGVLPALIPDRRGRGIPGYFFLFMQANVVFMITLNMAMTGFIEVLRRVDFQRPLPFPSWQIVWMEVASKAAIVLLPTTLSSVIILAVKPVLWPFAVCSLLAVPGFSLLLSSTVFLVTILFPDVDDPTQRQFRVLLIMLAIVIFGAIPGGLLAGLLALGTVPPVAGILAGLLALGLSVLLAAISGQLYANYNPSE